MSRKHVLVAAALLALLANSALAAPKKKKKKKVKEPEPAAEPAPAPEPTPAPEPEPAPPPPAPEPAAQTGGGGAAGSGGGGDASAGGGAAGDVTATVSPSGAWPMEIIARPPTLLKGLLRGDVGLPIARLSVTTIDPVSGMSTSASSTGVGLTVGAGYGISDKLEAGASYGLSLKDFEAKGPLRVYGAFNVMQNDKMKGAGIGSFTYDLADKTGALGVGLFFQFNLSPKMAVYTPGEQLQALLLADDPDGAGPITAVKPIDLHLPVGFAFQASKNLYAFAETSIATINIKDSATAVIFSDFTPLTVGAFYSMSNKMEFGAQIASPDVPHIADLFIFSVVARVFVGDAVKGAVPMPAAASGM